MANAIKEWAREYTLSSVLDSRKGEPSGTASEETERPRIETTKEELDAFALVARLLGERKVAYTDTASYLKIHLLERHTWVVCRLYVNRKHPKAWVPLEVAQVSVAMPAADVMAPEPGWTCIALESVAGIQEIEEVLKMAWDHLREEHPTPALAA